MKFDECLKALIALEASDRDLTRAPIDDIVDPYVVEFGSQIEKVRGAVASAFRDNVPLSARSELIFKYLALGAGPISLRQQQGNARSAGTHELEGEVQRSRSASRRRLDPDPRRGPRLHSGALRDRTGI